MKAAPQQAMQLAKPLADLSFALNALEQRQLREEQQRVEELLQQNERRYRGLIMWWRCFGDCSCDDGADDW